MGTILKLAFLIYLQRGKEILNFLNQVDTIVWRGYITGPDLSILPPIKLRLEIGLKLVKECHFPWEYQPHIFAAL